MQSCIEDQCFRFLKSLFLFHSFFYLQRLSELYYDIHRSYLKVAEVVNSEKRLFGRYYRVAFYGQVSDSNMFVNIQIPYTFLKDSSRDALLKESIIRKQDDRG